MKPAKLLLAMFAAGLLASAQTPRDAQSTRTLAMVFDLNALSAADLMRAQDSAAKFIQEQMSPADRIAIFTSGATPVVLQDFTGDHDALIAAVRKIMPAGTATARTSLQGIQSIAMMLEPLDGKKAMLYFSAPIERGELDQAQLRATIDAATRANLAIYSLDARGLDR